MFLNGLLQYRALIAFFAAAVGSSMLSFAVLPFASAIRRRSGAATWASALPSIHIDFICVSSKNTLS